MGEGVGLWVGGGFSADVVEFRGGVELAMLFLEETKRFDVGLHAVGVGEELRELRLYSFVSFHYLCHQFLLLLTFITINHVLDVLRL